MSSDLAAKPRCAATGSMSLPLLVIMVPVLFGLMGFALDLGRLYLIRGELNQAANAMALAAASKLIGTDAAVSDPVNGADAAVQQFAAGSTYNFGTRAIDPSRIDDLYFAAVTDAVSGTGTPTDSATATVAQVNITADAPLLFWRLLPGGESGTTPIAAQAVAGISAPLCTACGILPLAVATQDSAGADTANFGFIPGNLYTFSAQCTGNGAPAALAGTSPPTVPYTVLNRYDPDNAVLSEQDQLYRDGAQGLVASATPTTNACTTAPTTPLACVNVGDCEQVWTNAAPTACNAPATQYVVAALCGLYSRLDNQNTPVVCTSAVTDFAVLSSVYTPEVFEPQSDPYNSYTGNGRRILTLPIVDALPTTPTGSMTVLGFRQFLLEWNQDGTPFDPNDPNGRFVVLYIGNPAPVQQGWFDTRYAPACQPGSFSGPGKVVLHQ